MRFSVLLSQDPNADNTDVYAFVSPDRPDVTMVANYIPLEEPAGGSNFAAFGDIYTDNTLAWAWYRNGRTTEAARATHRALRLGTEDAMLHYHAGMIAAALGRARIARRHLRHALALHPHFDLRRAPRARVTLAALARPAPGGG